MITIDCIKGDIIEMLKNHECNAVIHGCNCFNVMGAGIAKQLKDLTDGDIYRADADTSHGDINKLGTYSVGHYKNIPIYNLYSQYTTAGQNCVAVHWPSVYEGLLSIIESVQSGTVIAMPYIGCGLAGGSVNDLMDVLDSIIIDEDELPDVTLKLVEYAK